MWIEFEYFYFKRELVVSFNLKSLIQHKNKNNFNFSLKWNKTNEKLSEIILDSKSIF